MLLSEHFLQTAAKNSARPALRYLGKETNYAELRTAIARLSYLYQHELGQYARVAFLARNSPAFVTTFLALTNTRGVAIPMDPAILNDDAVEWLKKTEATHIAVTSDLVNRAREILQAGHLSLPIIEIEKKHGGEYDTSFSPPPDSRPIDTDLVLILRTAGATGKPKPVAFNHKQLSHASSSLRGIYHLSATDRFLTTMTWSHPFALVHGMLFPLLTGATAIIDHGLEALPFLDFIVESRATRLLGNPPFFTKILVTCKNEKKPVPPFKSVTVACGSLSAELRKAFSLFKIPVCQSYGMTENAWTISLEDPEETSDGVAKGGRGLPGLKYKVLDANGDEIEGDDERVGFLAVTGPTVMSGYPGFEKDTKSAIRGTWLYTGDIARLRGSGDELRIEYVGRKEDVMWLDGEPVAFGKIDRVLRAIPGVEDGAAFCVSNSKNEPTLVCAIVKVKGSALSEGQIKELCAAKIPNHQVPRFVAFTDQVPRDPANNVFYFRLRAQFSAIAG